MIISLILMPFIYNKGDAVKRIKGQDIVRGEDICKWNSWSLDLWSELGWSMNVHKRFTVTGTAQREGLGGL